MKRIERVSNLVGIELKRENGEAFTIDFNDISEFGTTRIEGKTYSTILLDNGFKIIHRNTLQCTFYQINEDGAEGITEEVQEVTQEEPVENTPVIDLQNLEFKDEDSTVVGDFYSKEFKELVTIENEANICFGLVDKEDNVYIPTGSDLFGGEKCNIYKRDVISSIITESAKVYGEICDLNRKERKVDLANYELTATQDGVKYLFNKQVVDSVVTVDFEGHSRIAFVDGDNVILPIVSETKFYNVLSILKSNISDVFTTGTLYRKYKKQKTTKGISDIDYTNMFSYLSF